VSGTILAIESSCDDSCAAVLGGDGVVLSNIISSQGIHDRYGGVVPEIAARQHLQLLTPAIEAALSEAEVSLADIERVAVTQGPGLIGALLVGVAQAKAIAAARGLPLVAVDHLQGHVAANFIGLEPFEPPFICLIASGGHTLLVRVEDHSSYLLLGETLDDAAGEAFDKGARMLGLPFPGGPALQALAANGDEDAFQFPVARNVEGFNFSFAGVKTSLLYAIRDIGEDEVEARRADLAASYQKAIVDALVERLTKALDASGLDRVAIGGGVGANGLLRSRIAALGAVCHIPELSLCTDNAAMIASAARYLDACSPAQALTLDAYPSGTRR
jgi:N6-L-threonylcarbamoyladenine synthase